MSAIKKAYVEIVDLLEANRDSKVKTIIDQVIALASAKTGGGGAGRSTTFHKDENGTVVAIKCYYHQLWMDPRVVEFGQKVGSATGYNSMCKDGVSKWTKQQREAKQAKAQLLQDLANGTVQPQDLAQALQDIEANTCIIIPREDGYGFNTLEELLASQQQQQA
jgi:hypothetical protein